MDPHGSGAPSPDPRGHSNNANNNSGSFPNDGGFTFLAPIGAFGSVGQFDYPPQHAHQQPFDTVPSADDESNRGLFGLNMNSAFHFPQQGQHGAFQTPPARSFTPAPAAVSPASLSPPHRGTLHSDSSESSQGDQRHSSHSSGHSPSASPAGSAATPPALSHLSLSTIHPHHQRSLSNSSAQGTHGSTGSMRYVNTSSGGEQSGQSASSGQGGGGARGRKRRAMRQYVDEDDDTDMEEGPSPTTAQASTSRQGGNTEADFHRRKEEIRKQRIESEQRRRDELREGYRRLKDVLPTSNQKSSKVSLLDRATVHITFLENQAEMLAAKLRRAEEEVERLRQLNESLMLAAANASVARNPSNNQQSY